MSEQRYGCFVEGELEVYPDCILPEKCRHAARHGVKAKEQCEHWRPAMIERDQGCPNCAALRERAERAKAERDALKREFDFSQAAAVAEIERLRGALRAVELGTVEPRIRGIAASALAGEEGSREG